VRRLFYDLLTLAVIALLGAFAAAGLGLAQDLQQPGVYRLAHDHVVGARAAAANAQAIEFQAESPHEAEERRAYGRKMAEKIRSIYGTSAPTPREQNVTLFDYDHDRNGFEIFRGGLRDYGEYQAWESDPPPKAEPSPLCGKEEYRGSLRILIMCPDWPAIRRVTGSTMFPNEKGAQVFVRTTDPATAAFSITLRYRKFGSERTENALTLVHPQYDSGAGWVLGDIEIVSVEVTELRETAKAVLP
jgi:hypothetical protein